MEEKGLKITLATIQSFLVILLAYLLSFVKETEIVNTSVIIMPIITDIKNKKMKNEQDNNRSIYNLCFLNKTK